jgi:hypothetical protein
MSYLEYISHLHYNTYPTILGHLTVERHHIPASQSNYTNLDYHKIFISECIVLCSSLHERNQLGPDRWYITGYVVEDIKKKIIIMRQTIQMVIGIKHAVLASFKKQMRQNNVD